MTRSPILTSLALATTLSIAAGACSSDKAASPTTTVVVGPTTTLAPIAGVETWSGLSQNHVDGTVDYPQSPPVGGDHSGAWQNCGVYDEPIQNENAVHSMEHGAVWLAYAPDLPADQVELLRAFARGQSHVLVSPYEGLAAGEAVVASAWGLQLRLTAVTDPGLAEFVTRYQEGPQSPELGVTCSGAEGDPIE